MPNSIYVKATAHVNRIKHRHCCKKMNPNKVIWFLAALAIAFGFLFGVFGSCVREFISVWDGAFIVGTFLSGIFVGMVTSWFWRG